jgi:hypothetical protein
MNSHFVFMHPMAQVVLELAVFSLGGMLVMFVTTGSLRSRGFISKRVADTVAELGWMLFLAAWLVRWVIYDIQT